jgi:RNA polymerase sigma-70 factor (ECF subfamily)
METSQKIMREVIECCKAGDKKAFAEIVLHYQKRVLNIAYRMLGNMEEAEDLAQEVFLTVFESVKDLREEVKFGAWLTQITLNHCRNRWKYLKRRQYFNSDSYEDPMEVEDGAMPSSVAHPSDNPESLYEKKMIQQFIQKGLLKLNKDQRELLVLRDLQGFSYEEIGRLLQLSDGTVKSKLHRARMNLKEILERSTH